MRQVYFALYILCVLVLVLTACSKEMESDTASEKNNPRDESVNKEEVLMTVAPDPNLEAGSPFGYLFHFTAPFKTFEGKELAIYAYHEQTGEKVTAMAAEKIKEPSPGYDSLGRLTVHFELPKSGLWRYEAVLDGQFYADAVLQVD